ncbi:MAG: DUF4344 domain-containing metallopeptidase [Candidatus Sedimenticola sp. (ex Thyasira tokunagai)]
MKLLNITRAILLYFIFISTAFADSKAQVVFESTVKLDEKIIQNNLQSSEDILSFEQLINDTFKISQPLYFVFGGDDGPLYDTENNEIIIPYLFIKEIKSRFTKNKYFQTGVTVDEATIDALIHTMFHELAHALVAMYDLPVLGKEEDAADALATLLLIDSYQDGQEIAISAADLFDLESQDIKAIQEEDFWDEHSLDAKRYYSTICLVYGSSPAASHGERSEGW